MSNYIEYNGKIAFHPGYYIKEIVEESGLTQEDFAKRLDTTPKNLSLLLRGKQSLSVDMAMKLARMVGTSFNFWMSLQNSYDELIAEFKSEEELEREQQVFSVLDYKYFRDNFGLPDLPRKTDEQIKAVRKFLDVATLCVFKKRNMAVNFRKSTMNISESNIIKANIMVQIATNMALKTKAPDFDSCKLDSAIEYSLTLTTEHERFFPLIQQTFFNAGVILIILPNLPGSKINGATKKIGNNIMVMVNDRRVFSDIFWFTLFHEIGHVVNGDYGISFENEEGEPEKVADAFARDKLIPPSEYENFIENRDFSLFSIRRFAEKIHRDPAIVLGRLQNDKIIGFDDIRAKQLRRKYKVKM